MATADCLDVDVILRRLARYRGGRVLVPVAELGKALDMEQEAALDLAAELETLGLLDDWLDEGAPVVLLSALAAERLGLEIEPPDGSDLTRCSWVPVGTSRPPRRHRGPILESEWTAAAEKRGDPSPGLDGLADLRADDPAVDGPRRAHLADVVETTPRFYQITRAVPRVTHFHGSLSGAWFGPLPDGTVCPFCHSTDRLRPDECCLLCNRVGAVDAGLVRAALPSERPRKAYRPEALDGGKGRRQPREGSDKQATEARELLAALPPPPPKRKATARKAKAAARQGTGRNSFDLAALRASLG